MSNQKRSFLLGLLAILCWGSLATLGALLNHVPPFFLLGVAFLIGGLPALRFPARLFPSWKVSLLGITGYYGYHFFLFYSFRYAPAIEANLINYLWPIFLVLFTPIFFPGAGLKISHFMGGVLSAIGCTVLVVGKGGSFEWENFKGYLLALGAALSWPLYSILKKKMQQTDVWSVGGFCFGASILCFFTHAALEPAVYLPLHDWVLLVLMGLGPFGIAFYAWDRALALGDPRIIGALSYLTPVLSTSGLVLFGGQTLTSYSAVAMVLIIGGASTGLLDFLPQKVIKSQHGSL
jgi:drug/metabolite transporter (DMT)-like permease